MRYQSSSSPHGAHSQEPFPRELRRQAAAEIGSLRKASDLVAFLRQPVPDGAAWRQELTSIWSTTFGNPAAGTDAWETYAQGIGELGLPASRLVPAVVDGALQPNVNVGMVWTAFVATIAAGDQTSVERLAPVAFGRRRVATINLAEGATYHLCDKIQERLGEQPQDRSWLRVVIRRSTAAGASDSPQRNLCADVVLAFMGDGHPNAQAFIRSQAIGSDEDGRGLGRPMARRADTVLSWCGRQVDEGRQDLVAGDEALMGALMQMACARSMPRGFGMVEPHHQTTAAALLGRIAGGHHAG